jgi:Cdc6-like AAA superfamily ATPase
VADREAGDARQALRGLRGAREVARQDGADPFALEPPGQALGLGDAARGERVVRKLDGARGVAERLAVPDQKDQITLSPRRAWMSAGP